jgi:hypothetical protein
VNIPDFCPFLIRRARFFRPWLAYSGTCALFQFARNTLSVCVECLFLRHRGLSRGKRLFGWGLYPLGNRGQAIGRQGERVSRHQQRFVVSSHGQKTVKHQGFQPLLPIWHSITSSPPFHVSCACECTHVHTQTFPTLLHLPAHLCPTSSRSVTIQTYTRTSLDPVTH